MIDDMSQASHTLAIKASTAVAGGESWIETMRCRGAQGREESCEARGARRGEAGTANRDAGAIARPGAGRALAPERIAVAHAAGMPAPLHGAA